MTYDELKQAQAAGARIYAISDDASLHLVGQGELQPQYTCPPDRYLALLPFDSDLVRDAARLDFMVNRGANIDCYKGAWSEETVYRVTAFGSILTEWHDTYRAAIDAAIQAQAGGSES